MSTNKWKTVFLPLLLGVLFLSCATTGPGGKRSFIIVPTEQEVAIGAGMADEIARTETLLADTVWQNYVSDIGQRIVNVCDRKDIEYHFAVIESDQVNAFAAPGGYIYFYTGLLSEMRSEAELAAVISHEISHVVARHSIKRIQSALGVALVYELVFGGEDAGPVVNTAIGIGMSLTFAGYSRDAEREADRFGIHYMVQAGYDPNGAVAMFETLARIGGERSGNSFERLVSSHPETQERISNAKAQISEMQPLSPNLFTGKSKYETMLQRLQVKSTNTPSG